MIGIFYSDQNFWFSSTPLSKFIYFFMEKSLFNLRVLPKFSFSPCVFWNSKIISVFVKLCLFHTLCLNYDLMYQIYPLLKRRVNVNHIFLFKNKIKNSKCQTLNKLQIKLLKMFIVYFSSLCSYYPKKIKHLSLKTNAIRRIQA